MSAAPDRDLLETIAVELGVHPSFVEKDWHAMQLVALLASTEPEPPVAMRPVFSGGTSLSKGYGLIRRFSEDLDFKLTLPEAGISRPARRAYRHRMIDAIRATGEWTIHDADIEIGNASQFFSCLVGYRNILPQAEALRPQVKLEITFVSPALPTEDRPLRSFVAEARNEAPEVPVIACVSPVETAADKLSALTWRVLTRERGGVRDDPFLIRHLFDLAALEAHARWRPEFPPLLHRLLTLDAARGNLRKEIAALAPADRIGRALDILTRDPEYSGEYVRFVLGMSYAAEDETLSFADALQAVRRLGSVLL